MDDIVSLESCACVVQNNQESNAKPELKINFDKLITHIDIISESQIIEVFGNSEEYLLTCSGEFIDDWIGMAVYHCKITLPNIPSCVLKVILKCKFIKKNFLLKTLMGKLMVIIFEFDYKINSILPN